MPVIFGKVVTSSQLGRRLEHVVCEKCNTDYFYELTRVGVGKGLALYNIGQTAAARRAASAAQQNLSSRLNVETELVPCPKCNWVNQELVDAYRCRKYRKMPTLIAVFVGAGVIALPILWAMLEEVLGYSSRIPASVTLALAIIIAATPAFDLLIRRRRRAAIDPNPTYPRLPTLPVGTPPGLIPQLDKQTGETFLVPVAATAGKAIESDKHPWAVLRPGQLLTLPCCCMCLEETSQLFKSPMQVDERSEIAVPVCSRCNSVLGRRWWRTILMVGAVSSVLAVIGIFWLPIGDLGGRIGVFGILAAFTTLIGGVVIAARVCRPYRIVTIDRDRGIFKFAANNPGYTALLRNVIQTRDAAGIAF
jgi:hypothetical protein